MSKKNSVVEESLVFDPNKNYQWQPTDEFTITGGQFASIYHALQQEMNTAGGAPLMLKSEAYGVVMEILKKGVSIGTIVEANAPELEDKVRSMFKK